VVAGRGFRALPLSWRDRLYGILARKRCACSGGVPLATCPITAMRTAFSHERHARPHPRGYGTFGGRLAQLLAGEPRLTLLIAGRSRHKAEAFCARLRGAARREAFAFDRDGDAQAALAAAQPDIVVDASGPFQFYQGDLYRLVKACVARGADFSISPTAATSSRASRNSTMPPGRTRLHISGVSSFPCSPPRWCAGSHAA